MFLATSHPSRQSSSNTRRWWTSCATTSRPLRPGPSTPHRRAVVKAGTSSGQLHETQILTTGSCRDPFSLIFFHPTLLSLLKGPFKTRFSLKNRDFLRILLRGILNWCKFNGLPSIPKHQIQDLGHSLWSTHTSHIINHITRSSIQHLEQLFQGAFFHCEDKHASSLRIFCPCLYSKAIERTFLDPDVFGQVHETPDVITSALVAKLVRQYHKSYPWAAGKGRQLPSGYILAKKKKNYESGRPIISFVDAPFRPMLNILARPDHFAAGDVYHLLSVLQQAPEHGHLQLYNQDLAGFFTSIDQQRFIGAWYMLLDFLRPHMDVSENGVFSVYPGRFNNPGDLIKGRTFRRLNVTRKILIKDIPCLITIRRWRCKLLPGPPMCVPTSRQPNGKPSLACFVPHGRVHQRTNLVNQLQIHSSESPPFHSTHPLR